MDARICFSTNSNGGVGGGCALWRCDAVDGPHFVASSHTSIQFGPSEANLIRFDRTHGIDI